MRTALLTLLSLVSSLSVAAEDSVAATPAVEPAARGAAFLAGLQFGALIPLQGLGPNVDASLDVGALLPFGGRSLGVLVSVGYAQPVAAGSVSDPRVVGGASDWTLTQQQLVIAPTLLYRLTVLGRVVPYAGLSFRVSLLQATASGTAGGQAISKTVEQATRYGVGGRLGAEIVLGPGGITVEGQFSWAQLGTRSAGAGTQLSGLTFSVGYRLIL